jgi:hypothetical protein
MCWPTVKGLAVRIRKDRDAGVQEPGRRLQRKEVLNDEVSATEAP